MQIDEGCFSKNSCRASLVYLRYFSAAGSVAAFYYEKCAACGREEELKACSG
jgi:hypothetical protein